MIQIDSLKDSLGAAWHLGEFLFTTVIIKYIVVHWLADRIKNLFRRLFIKTERDLAIWLHYRNRMLNKGHQHVRQENCDDGICKFE